MKLGIIGLPQSGKKTLFKILTGTDPPLESGKTVSGIADIRDERFSALVKLYSPKKNSPAKINIELLPKLEPGSSKDQSVFSGIAGTDAICHLVRAFQDASVYHINGLVNPQRDIDIVNDELLLHDLIFIEKRFERLDKSQKKKTDSPAGERELLDRFKASLEGGIELRNLSISKDDEKIIASYPFLTMKRMLAAINIDDSALSSFELLRSLSGKYSSRQIDLMQVSAKLEGEIAQLDSEDERADFMKESGIAEPALQVLSALAMKSLGLISFFTVGKDEVKQWLIRSGSSAPEAAGVIHSDIQRGFIRAEVIKYSDLTALGSEDAVKKAGKSSTMGRDYIVEDGDIINFRFNV